MATTDIRLNPSVAARIVGAAIAAAGAVVLVTTFVVALLDLHTLVVLVTAAVVLVAAIGGGAWLARSAYVVRLTDDGYRVRFVRGVGVAAARWKDVDDAVTGKLGDAPVVVLRLRDGRSTTVPVQILAVDREEFVRTVQDHLQRGHGLRRL